MTIRERAEFIYKLITTNRSLKEKSKEECIDIIAHNIRQAVRDRRDGEIPVIGAVRGEGEVRFF